MFAQEFNEIHAQGVNLNGDTNVNFFAAKNKMTNGEYNLNSFGSDKPMTDFDSDPLVSQASYYWLTAESFTVSSAVMTNPSNIAAASDIVNGVSNADIVNKLVALKSDVTMFKQGDPASFLQTLVGEIGVDTKAAQNFAQSQENIVNSVTNQRLSVSGVDIDEEAMNLAKYQEAYSLSAKIISVMNEIYDKLINEMGI